MAVFCVVAPCSLVEVYPVLPDYTAQQHSSHLHIRRRENLKSHMTILTQKAQGTGSIGSLCENQEVRHCWCHPVETGLLSMQYGASVGKWQIQKLLFHRRTQDPTFWHLITHTKSATLLGCSELATVRPMPWIFWDPKSVVQFYWNNLNGSEHLIIM
jgi:hypothetical protein